MMCVKLTLAPVVRASWLLRMRRLTSSKRAGTERTLVAVGTPRLASMFATMREAAPRSTVASSGADCPIAVGAGVVGTLGAALVDGAAGAAGAVATGAEGTAPSLDVAWLWGTGTGAGR